jgi:hypothetical protein
VPTPSPTPEPAGTSLFARLLNVFAVPGEVFDEVKVSRPSIANWLLPALLLAVATTLIVMAAFSQPATLQKMLAEAGKNLDKQVQAGKMSQADADKATDLMEKYFPLIMKVAGSFTSVLVSFARIFWWALVLWLIARRVLHAPIPYMKAAEAAGLATMITVLGAIVTLLLVINLGRMFSAPSLALAVADFDVKNKGHLLLGAANVFSFWFLAVISVALARLSSVPFARAFLLVVTYWVIQELLLILSGLGQFAL